MGKLFCIFGMHVWGVNDPHAVDGVWTIRCAREHCRVILCHSLKPFTGLER